MAITITSDAATIGTTEYSLPADSTTLAPQTDDCMVQIWVDWVNLASGDQYRFRFYEKINGGTARVILDLYITPGMPPTITPAYVVGEGWDATVQKIAGTDRSIPWSIRKVT